MNQLLPEYKMRETASVAHTAETDRIKRFVYTIRYEFFGIEIPI